MIHSNIEFHNVTDLRAVDQLPGLRLQRLPDAVRAAINPGARGEGLMPTNCELRFVTDAPTTLVSLFSATQDEYVTVCQGDWVRDEVHIAPGQTRTLELSLNQNCLKVKRPASDPGRFAPNVWRLCLSGTGRVHFVALDADGYSVRPPQAQEKPRATMLCYGSSITHGYSASRMANPYIVCAARLLGVDVCNLGFAGCCHVENAMADYLAGRNDWDVITLELGINVLGWMEVDEFRRRCQYMVDKIASAHPDKPVLPITVFPVGGDLIPEPGAEPKRIPEAFREALRQAVAAVNRANVHLVEGRDILSTLSGWTCDMCHPSDFGHAIMGTNLASAIEPWLAAR